MPAVIVPSGRKAGFSAANVVERCSRPVVLVLSKDGRAFAAGYLDGNDLVLEPAGRLGRGEALLRAQCPPVLRLAADLEFADQILGVPARRLHPRMRR